MANRTGSSRITAALLAAMALGGLALGLGPAVAQQASKTCTHQGQTYNAGEKLMISGKLMQCDGATGAWVPAKA